MILLGLITALLVALTNGEERCRHSDYFYSVIQAEVKCHPECQDANGKCNAAALTALCQDGDSGTCDLAVRIQSSEHYWKAPWYTRVWVLQDNTNPASYVKGKAYPRDSIDYQYVYQMYDEVDEVADENCFSFIVSVLDRDPYGHVTILGSETVTPPVPTKAEFDENPNMQGFRAQPELNTAAKCTGKDGQQHEIKIDVWLLIIYRRFDLNDGTKLVYLTNDTFMEENCGKDPSALPCQSEEYFFVKELTHAWTKTVTGYRPRYICFGGQIEGYWNHPPGWDCGVPQTPFKASKIET